MDQARATPDRKVRTRRVFYIPGYDPMPPRRYRELYRREGAAQAAISGYSVEPAPKAGGRFGWGVRARIEGAEVEAQVEVLVWSDIVRDSMDAGIAATYAQLARTAWVYITTGALRRLMWLRKGPVIAALYPVGMLLLQLALALAAGWLGAWVLRSGISAVGVPGAVGWIALPFVVAFVLRWFRKQDGRFFAYYLMHDYAFSARWRGANPDALEERMTQMGQTIAAALASDADEVLIVGHSSGAHLAVSILADLVREGRVPANGPVLSFLSLGQVVPMMSFLPAAHRLRADLAFLSKTDALTWVDVTAPGDGCAFALCDPVAVSGVRPEGAHQPLILSAAFTQTLLPQTWTKLRWRFFRLHFQYLCAFDNLPDKTDAYDYFRITAGPKTLATRFAGRAPSKSRIDVAASRYTSTAA
ncbi:hypothetical protein PARPLA_01956 [Rhodobacteraceae bacterium THAF1]|uniref:hypothetical protein n=1 Tax=Palleronia sp. THAF1 TaxID=2587842 RepID=UPI000F3ADED4|nr:hypothetical protein [Palleronia sp. THAF1]QFU08909.1 hypothetical protein FIU81_09515 [Palleronia sp. THAF1]VDC24379.1 hypothetical protein PARPLA_01956 [Rhodobacteraceae bacterium THAF1]